jgi:hypothetical protein
MIKKVLIVSIIMVVLVFTGFWIKHRLTIQDIRMHWSQSVEGSGLMPPELFGRRLTFVSNANVPLRVEQGQRGIDLLGLLGIPERYRPFHIYIGRTPERDEWNGVVFEMNSIEKIPEPEFLTENNGNFLNLKQVTAYGPIVATHQVGNDQDIVILHGNNRVETISPSPSLDRWPSIERMGNILFQSYRDGNPGGDLYLAESNDSNGWDTYRLTDNPNVEYILPMMDPEGKYVVAIERELMVENGRVILWELDGRELTNPRYLTDQPERINQTSISENAGVICWEKLVDGVYYVCVWTEQDGVSVLGPPDTEQLQGKGWAQPSVSPDGVYVTFVDSVSNQGSYQIGIYNLNTDEITRFEGCGGYFMFPSLSGPLNAD